MLAAARAGILRAFHARGGYEDDGHGSARSWLRAQTRITGGAAAAAMGWMRRLAAHPAVADALAAAQISASWARQVCDWSDLLPDGKRADADAVLLAAAAGGLLLCTFHHLIAVHRWGWAITLHPDGTVSATSPDHSKTVHSHSPPAHAA